MIAIPNIDNEVGCANKAKLVIQNWVSIFENRLKMGQRLRVISLFFPESIASYQLGGHGRAILWNFRE